MKTKYTEQLIDTDYMRVIPRDLFNEAKLLKCIGRLVLLIHDGNRPNGIEFEHDGEAFNIGLMDEGSLSVDNITFTVNGTNLLMKTTYNSKSSYPLHAELNYCDTLVFDEAGEYTPEFIELCNSL